MPRPIVLVHGAFAGGWIWKLVAERLRAKGYTVFTPTLTGTGDRAHLLSGQITVDTHVQDLESLFEAEELQHAVLVGHSYGGIPVTVFADRFTSTLSRLIYLDALIPEDGETGFSLLPNGTTGARLKDAAEFGASVALPAPQPATLTFPDGPNKAWFARRLKPHPLRTYTTAIHLSKPPGAGLPVTYVAYTAPALSAIEPSRQRARSKADWEYIDLPVPHDVELIDPDKIVDLIAARAR